MSWIMRIQNHVALDAFSCDVPLQDLINMCAPTLGGICTLRDILMAEDQPWNNLSTEPSNAAELNRRKSAAPEFFEVKKTDKVEKTEENLKTDIKVSCTFYTHIFTFVANFFLAFISFDR